MAGTLGRLMLQLGLDSKEMVGGLPVAETAVTGFETKTTGSMAKIGASVAGLALVGGALALGASSIKSAGDFQQSTTQIVTGAGEQESAIDGVRKGMLAMAGDVGTSAMELSKGMYMIESAGFHGASGLNVLHAAAEGAKVGGADMQVMADALTTTLNAYHLSADQAVPITNQMVAAVAAGKMHMQDFAGSLSAVLPIAASAKLNFAEIGGAMATMTGQGMSAQQASQDLAATISQLQKPSQIAVKEMAQMGLQSNEVTAGLGKKGLSGTLEDLTVAITKHMGPAGTVLMDSFNQSKAAAADADTMLSKLPKSIQGIAHEFQAGTITSAQWRKDLKNLSPEQKALAMEFAHTQTAAHAFNDLLKSGSPQAQTYNAALGDMLGGTTGLNTALMLTGGSLATYKDNVASVGEASRKGGKDVQGWSLVQGDFNTKVSQFKAGLEAASITIGTQVLPVASRFMDLAVKELPKVVPAVEAVGHGFEFVGRNLGIIAPILGGLLGMWVAYNVQLAITAVQTAAIGEAGLASMIRSFLMLANTEGLVTAAQWLLNLAMDANPIGLTVLAIGALIAIGLLLVTHWSQVTKLAGQVGGAIKDFVVGAFHAVVAAVGTAIAWVKQNWPLILAILTGPVGLAVLFVTSHFKQIKAVVVGTIENVIGWVTAEIPKLPRQIGYALGQALVHLYKLQMGFQHWLTTDLPAFIIGVGNWFASLPTEVAKALLKLILAFGIFEISLLQWAAKAIPAFVGSVLTWLGQLPPRTGNMLAHLLDQFALWMSHGGSSIIAGFGDLVGKIITTLNDLPNRAVQIGADIVLGVIKGIASNTTKAIGAIGDFVKGLVTGAHDAGKGGSPYMLFADEIGNTGMVGGIVKGLGMGAPGALAAVKGLVRDMSAVGASSSLQLAPATAGGRSWEAQQRGSQQGDQGQQGPGGNHQHFAEGAIVVNNPRTELDVTRGVQMAQHLATMASRGVAPAPRLQPQGA